jgi:hypothetical protein
MRKASFLTLLTLVVLVPGCNHSTEDQKKAETESLKACQDALLGGPMLIAATRDLRFQAKVNEARALCRGGVTAVTYRPMPWVDWANYYATGDASSQVPGLISQNGILAPNSRGVTSALLDLEYQRVELIKFNLFDNNKTYQQYVEGRNGVSGPALKTWKEMRLPPSHPDYRAAGGGGDQLCTGDLIRWRNITGICNDTQNPLMGSSGQLFARNMEFDTTFPDLGRTELTRNRHGERLGLLKPDPQLISRKLFTRKQDHPDACKDGYGTDCDYQKAPFFNVLAAFWIQFMTHDWFSHLEEGHNAPEFMEVGCNTPEARNTGCRPDDRMDKAYVAEASEPGRFESGGKSYLTRAPKTFKNNVTAWWDASQIYGYDQRSRARVARDPKDRAKLLMAPAGSGAGDGEKLGYLTTFTPDAPINPEWAGQETSAFPDNWTIGMSFYHNVFSREHNLFVDEFRKQAALTPDADSGLRNPARPHEAIRYRDVTPDELFEVTRLVVAAEIAKIHTIEWTTQLLYDEPLYKGMNANWNGLLSDAQAVAQALEQIAINNFKNSPDPKLANQWFSVFASGPGIFGLGNHRYQGDPVFTALSKDKKDIWDISNPDHVNGGTNHFGSPFNFPEEFVTVYRLHALVPDLIEYRQWNNDPNKIQNALPVVTTFQGAATGAMRSHGLANLALSMGRQRLGLLTLQNIPRFMQNLKIPRLESKTQQIDIAALDLIRDRERGVPRFNEFRRQYGLRSLTSFDDFVDHHLPADSPARRQQEDTIKTMREIYGQHTCSAAKVITDAQRNADGSPINDCLGHADGSLVDNVEDVDTVVGWLAEYTHPHGFAISETQFSVFILNASRRLFSDRFFTSSFRPEFYSSLGVDWVNNNGPGPKVMEKGAPNGHTQLMLPLKRVLLRTMPELAPELENVVNSFDPWARDRGEYYSLDWKPRKGAEQDPAFKK